MQDDMMQDAGCKMQDIGRGRVDKKIGKTRRDVGCGQRTGRRLKDET